MLPEAWAETTMSRRSTGRAWYATGAASFLQAARRSPATTVILSAAKDRLGFRMTSLPGIRPPTRLEVPLHLPVLQVYLPARVLRDVVLVGDENDGLPLLMERLKQR